jgi:hypothetical protein
MEPEAARRRKRELARQAATEWQAIWFRWAKENGKLPPPPKPMEVKKPDMAKVHAALRLRGLA